MIFGHRKALKSNGINGRRIGILGLAPRVGTTHIAVAVCNYLSEYERKRVLLLEESRHNDIGALVMGFGAKEPGEPYEFHRVTYIPSQSIGNMEALMDLDSDCTVSDLGCNFKQGLSRILLCDIKILVGTDGIWRENEYDKLEDIRGTSPYLNSWRLFINLGNVRKLKEKDRFGITACCFPFEPDPVYPGEETVNFLREAIYG